MGGVQPPLPAADGGTVRLRLLERPAIRLPDGRELPLADKDAALLMLLARRGAMDRDTLAGLLWPRSAAATAQGSLRQRDHRLAKAVGRSLFTKQGALALAAGTEHDLGDTRARLAADPWALRSPLLAGIAFPDEPDLAREVDAERRRWDGEIRETLMQLIAARNAAHEIAGAIACAQRVAADEPTSEHAARLLMRLHHRRGDRALALETYDTLKRNLHDALGEEPSQETVDLVRQIDSACVPDSPPVAALPLALQNPTHIGGRADLIVAARQRLQQGGPVLLTGPAGIGKTSVFDELQRALQPAVVCRLQPEDRDIAHAAARRLALAWPTGADGTDIDLLHWLRTPPGTLAPGVVSPARMYGAFAGALAALPGGAQAIVAVDDLHFADGEGAALFGRLLREGPRRPWLLTARGHELAEPLSQWLLAQPDGDEAQFELAPLTAAGLRPLLAAALPPQADVDAWAAELASHCSGHPLSALQVLRALHAQGALTQQRPPAVMPVPREASQRIARQLERCDERTQHLAYAAALCGGEFGVEVARRVLRCNATELIVPWRRLQGLGLARNAAYTHELVRQAVAEMVPAALAPAIHGEIAAALHDAGVDPARRTRHWVAAARWAEAARDQLAAADIALAAGARREARERLRDAAVHFDRAGLANEAFDALARAVPLTLSQLSADEAQAEADVLGARAATPAQRCEAALACARLAGERHDEDALTQAQAAQRLALETGNAALQRRAARCVAAAQHVTGATRESLALVDALLADGEAAAAHADIVPLTELRAMLLADLGRRREAAELLVDSWRRAVRAHDLVQTADQAGNAAVQLGYLCRAEQALELAEVAMDMDHRLGSELSFAAVNEMTVAALCADLGRYGRALEVGQRCVDTLRRSGLYHFLISAENTLASTYLHLGRADLAHPLLADAPLQAPAWARALRRAAQGGLERARGRSPLPSAREARMALESMESLYTGFLRHRIRLEEARWDTPEAAIRVAVECIAWAHGNQHVALERIARCVEIEGLRRLGRHAEAASRADVLAADCAPAWEVYNFYVPELWLNLVNAWDAAGRRTDADRLARHAKGWIDERAVRDVPAVFRDSFLQRNAINVALLARAAA